jgi:hypothetical protein
MKKIFILFACYIVSINAYSIEFEKMNIEGYDKKIVSEKQIRFVKKNNPRKVIHLQVNSYNAKKPWTETTLKKDVEEMLETRKEMYKVFGFSDVIFYDYKLAKFNKRPQLNIFGSYKKIDDKKVYFSESNIYYTHDFLQVKVINEAPDDSGKIKQKEMDDILVEIKAQDLELK